MSTCAYLLTRHNVEKGSNRWLDMERIANGDVVHIRDWDNNNFDNKNKCYQLLPKGSTLFFVGTESHAAKALKLGYRVIKAMLTGKNRRFSHHEECLKISSTWVKL